MRGFFSALRMTNKDWQQQKKIRRFWLRQNDGSGNRGLDGDIFTGDGGRPGFGAG
jgi:hypothetical protein